MTAALLRVRRHRAERTLFAEAPGFSARLYVHTRPVLGSVAGVNAELQFFDVDVDGHSAGGARLDYALARLDPGSGELDLRGGAFAMLADGGLETVVTDDFREHYGPWIDALLAWHFAELKPGEYRVADAPSVPADRPPTAGSARPGRPNPDARAERRIGPQLDALEPLMRRYVLTAAQHRAVEAALRRGWQFLRVFTGDEATPGLPYSPDAAGRPRWALVMIGRPGAGGAAARLARAGFLDAAGTFPQLGVPGRLLVLPWRPDVPPPEPWL